MSILVSKIRGYGRSLVLACDGNCSKAWGLNFRPFTQLDPNDEDDIAWLADDELDIAPTDPGTYEGEHAKPLDAVHNKWCFRECERSSSCEVGRVPVLTDWRQRVYNKREGDRT